MTPSTTPSSGSSHSRPEGLASRERRVCENDTLDEDLENDREMLRKWRGKHQEKIAEKGISTDLMAFIHKQIPLKEALANKDAKKAMDKEWQKLEDKGFVESQHPEDLPLDLMEEIHIPADRMSVEFRRSLAKRFGLGTPLVN